MQLYASYHWQVWKACTFFSILTLVSLFFFFFFKCGLLISISGFVMLSTQTLLEHSKSSHLHVDFLCLHTNCNTCMKMECLLRGFSLTSSSDFFLYLGSSVHLFWFCWLLFFLCLQIFCNSPVKSPTNRLSSVALINEHYHSVGVLQEAEKEDRMADICSMVAFNYELYFELQ